MTEHQTDLLVDLAKLLHKHGPGAFESLAKLMRSPGAVEKVADVLRSVAGTYRSVSAKRRSSTGKEGTRGRTAPLPEEVLLLKTTNPERYDVLRAFHADLLARRTLPTLGEIRRFAAEADVPLLRTRSKSKAIHELLRSLSKLSQDELSAKLRAVEGSDDRSLESWYNIILRLRQTSEKEPGRHNPGT